MNRFRIQWKLTRVRPGSPARQSEPPRRPERSLRGMPHQAHQARQGRAPRAPQVRRAARHRVRRGHGAAAKSRRYRLLQMRRAAASWACSTAGVRTGSRPSPAASPAVGCTAETIASVFATWGVDFWAASLHRRDRFSPKTCSSERLWSLVVPARRHGAGTNAATCVRATRWVAASGQTPPSPPLVASNYAPAPSVGMRPRTSASRRRRQSGSSSTETISSLPRAKHARALAQADTWARGPARTDPRPTDHRSACR